MNTIGLGISALLLSACFEPKIAEELRCASIGLENPANCPPDHVCLVNSGICVLDRCGDGVVAPDLMRDFRIVVEVCDDGNREDGDGCRADCQGFEVCQDGQIDVGEDCDNADQAHSDGCSATCRFEGMCGDSVADEGEHCFDVTQTLEHVIVSNQAGTVAVAPHVAALGDVNGDSRLDIVTTSGASGSGEVSQLLRFIGTPGGSFGSGQVNDLVTPLDDPVALLLADFDGASSDDLYLFADSSGFSHLQNDATGTFGEAVSKPLLGGDIIGLAPASVNGDAFQDLIVLHGSGQISVLPGNGTVALGTPLVTDFASIENPQGFTIADVNGDGLDDVAVATLVPSQGVGSSGELWVLLSDGSGGFTLSSPIALGGGTPTSVIAGDVDRDGDMDLLAAQDRDGGEGTGVFGSGHLQILLNNGIAQ